ncbi:deoxyadenosine kinase [Propionigenium maris DSM 9537]|uniref:Deoxyadenosine kinase n=1 Tax=Propionigenium maris DSM 9537 TaxID=1123000 RepID=A0A9W6LPN7_9FUSO|nr:deoxynucleoside kinase [Propionigenium maris]GLI58008.1 deoxyadenosine kinase [Propionigenium maris DSM 9537]
MYYRDFFEKLIMGEERMKGTICIDGVVGAGKSTLGEILAQELGIEFFREPVLDNPLLDKFYYDKKRYSFPLQVFFLNKRFKMIKDAEKLNGCVMDRSIYGDVIFAKMLMEDEDMTPEEFDVYEELLHNMLEHIKRPRLMIYLENSVEKAMEKIKRRGRDYEQIVPVKYWETLNENYREYFENYNISEILTINVDDLDIKENPEDRRYFIDLVKSKLAEAEGR